MPKILHPLSEVAVKNAKPQAKAFKLADGGGLYLEVLPSGGKSWRLKYRADGTEKRLTFGLWPAVSLKQARQLRDEAKALLAAGIDPGEKRKQDRAAAVAQAQEDATTFEVVARDWHARQSKTWSGGHAEKVMMRMAKHLFPAFGGTSITGLGAPELLGALRKIEENGNHETAHRLRQYVEGIYAFAIASGLAKDNPGSSLRKALTPHRAKNRAAIVDPKGVAELLRAVWDYEGRPETRAALMLLAYLFPRPGELRAAEWSEFNLQAEGGPVWIIPAARTKMRREHVVPLPEQVLEIIEELRQLTGGGRLLFPCVRSSGRCMSNMTMTAALRRLGFGQDEMCAHGFRALASTLLHELGHPHHIIEAQLAHVTGNTVSRAYDRAQYLPERRKLVTSWADYLDGLRAGAKVIPIGKAENG